MANRKFIIVALALIFSSLPSFVLAYNNITTHRAITKEAIGLFNHFYPDETIDVQLADYVIKGSSDEDEALRWLNHFYDPVHNRGFKGMLSSKRWAQSTDAQSLRLGPNVIGDYFSASTDYSWDRAVYDYAWGDKNRGLEALGHVLHLIQDTTVPDHTRDDAHVIKKTYENYTDQFDLRTINLADKYIKTGYRPLSFDNLDSYFDYLANYSNNNFFSDDTILDDFYSGPIIFSEKSERLKDNQDHTFGFNRIGYRLIEVKSTVDISRGKISRNYFLNDNDNLIMFDYWSLLSEKAIGGSAGVIKLFFDEVAKEKQTHHLLDKNKSLFDRFLNNLGDKTTNALSAVGLALNRSDPNDISVIATSTDGGVNQKTEEDILDQKNSTDILQILYNQILSLQKQINDYKSLIVRNDKILLGQITESQSAIGSIIVGQSLDQKIVEQVDPVVGSTSPSVSLNSPIILSPDLSVTLSTTSVVFSGLADPGLVVFSDFGHDVSTATEATSSINWSLSFTNLPQGTTTIKFYTRDGDNHVSNPTVAQVFVDSLPPILLLTIDDCSLSSISDACVIAPTSTLNFSWRMSKGADYNFELLELVNDGEQIASSTLAQTTESSWSLPVSVREGENKQFIILAKKDNLEYFSEPQSIWFYSRPIAINEYAGLGTKASSSDRWLELYNNLPKEIDITNWVITDGINEIKLVGQIDEQGYYLIENFDDNVIPDVSADLVAHILWPTDDFSLQLKNNYGGMIDQANISNITSLPSLERISSMKSGNDSDNWNTNDPRYGRNGLDRNNETILGTPKQFNSASVPRLM